MDILTSVYDSLNWKRSNEFCAERLKMDLELYLKTKQQILEHKSQVQDELKESVIKRIQGTFTETSTNPILEDRVVEMKEDLTNGTAVIKALSSEEPNSPEDVERIVKIQGSTKWKLSSYWNKQQPNGQWIVSAQVTAKKDSEISLNDIEEILHTVFEPKDFPPLENYPKLSNKKALFVYTSDKHISAYVDDKTALYKNEYNLLTYEARMKLVLTEVMYLRDTFGHFEDIFIIDLGDKVDGWNSMTTRGGHKLPQNMSNREAFETATQVEKEFYDFIIQANVANNYHTILNANSNHGGDFEYIVNRALEIYLNTRYPFINTKIQQKFIDHLEYGKHIFLLTHGKDDSDLKFGLPKNLDVKTENFLNKYLMKNKIDVEENYVSVIKGDLHINNSEEAFGFRYRNVMSLFGASKWIGNNFGPSKPGCSFDIIEPDTNRVYEHRILFSH